MQTRLGGQLRVKRHRDHVVLTDSDRVALKTREYFDPGAMLAHPRSTYEHGMNWAAADTRQLQIGFEGAKLAAECVAVGGDVKDA